MLASVGEDLFRAVLQGAPPGTVYALVALGFVLAYKTSGIFNLAFGAQAYVSAVVYFKTHTEWGWPIIPAFIVSVVILAPLLGVVLEWLVFRHLRTAAPVAGLVVAIGLTIALPAIVDVVMNFEPKTGQPIEGIVPRGNNVFYDVWGRLLVQPQRTGRDGRRAAGHRRAGRCCSSSRRSACACGRSSRARA